MNPTDTVRALVEKLEQAAHTNGWNDGTDKSAIKTLDEARAGLLAYVAGVEQQLARYKKIYESNSAAFIAIRKAFGIEADETVVPYILKYAPPLATRPTEARDDG